MKEIVINHEGYIYIGTVKVQIKFIKNIIKNTCNDIIIVIQSITERNKRSKQKGVDNMRILEWKIWGGNRSENDALYIWASDADIALQTARMEDRDLDATQWTGREKEFGIEE